MFASAEQATCCVTLAEAFRAFPKSNSSCRPVADLRLISVATADIEPDEELFSVNRRHILSVQNSELYHEDRGKAVIEKLNDRFGDDPWRSLVLVMVYEYMMGDASPFKPYFDVLPATFDTLMFWTEDELDILQASASRSKIGKEAADHMIRTEVVESIRENEKLFHGTASPSVDELSQLAHRMASTIMAYAFDIEKEPSKQAQDEEGYVSDDEEELLPKGMVPLADMLNADADRNNARLFYGEDVVVMKAICPIRAGEEVLNDYGPLPRADLLRRYGYITPNYAQYDIVEISTSSIMKHFDPESKMDLSPEPYWQDEVSPDKLDYLQQYEIDEDGFDITWPAEGESFLSMELQSFLAVMHVTNEQFQKVKRLKPTALATRTTLLADYISILERRRAEYITTAEDDRKILDNMPETNSSASEERRRMAICVRLGEKELLQAALDEAIKMRNAVAPNEGDAKRKHEAAHAAGSTKKRKNA